MMAHPLAILSPEETNVARDLYDVIGADRIPEYQESVVDLVAHKQIKHTVVGKQHHASLTLSEFDVLVDRCMSSPLFQEAIAQFSLPDGFEVVIEPWPYGGLDNTDENRRFFQGLCFAQDKRSGNPDTNFYSFPLPIIPVMDAHTQQIIRVDRPATGGKGDGLLEQTFKRDIIGHCKPSEYVPELLTEGTRADLKPLNVVQPEGPSFRVTNESLVEWQKWRFRVGFNPREGATIHDLWYDGRSVMHRLAISEMTVPYADPRPPFHRKQAFDFGDGGGGNMANNLSLGCDCLGVIKYFDAVITKPDGTAEKLPNAICLHEQDNGIAWKHSNWRTGRAVVTRNRELVVQFIITLANYEYIFAYKFNQSGDITVEARATGILNVVNIDAGKVSDYGNVKNSVVVEESHPVPMNAVTNPNGNFYQITKNTVERASWIDAAPEYNRTIKMINPHKTNPISGNPVGFKFIPLATQNLLADPESVQARRAQFAQHHVWVTKYQDNELYAGGRYTLQSQYEIDGVADAVRRGDSVADTDVVVWNSFGITHNPRVEDWPVMPVETFQLMIRPADFFVENPSIDVPSNKNVSSRLVDKDCCPQLEDPAPKDDWPNHARFRAVDLELDTLREEMRTLSARLKEVESANSVASSRPTVSAAPTSLQRILNPPKSPSYVGPTSAEFGLDHQDDPLLYALDDRDNIHADNFQGNQDSRPASPVAQISTGSTPTENSTSQHSLHDLGLEETLRLVQVYEDTVGIMYPCVDLASLRTYVVEYYHSQTSAFNKSSARRLSRRDEDWFHARDIQVLNIVLATALLVESHGQSERAAQLADSVEDRFASRLKVAQVDMKECLILTLLSLFHSYRDDEVIAWRLTGMAARGSMELGLHRQETWKKTGGVFPGALEWIWASRLFWCIYVLDRKWSFGTGLPFAIQDSDMDTNLPEPGHSTPYLTCLISYARLGTKIWGLIVGWSNRSREATSEGCAFLDAQVQQWVHSIPRELRFDPSWRSPAGPVHTDRTRMLQVLLALQANQLRILVYRQNLLSGDRILDDIPGALIAVETAKSTIHMLDYYSRVSNVYFQRPEPFNYFLISALAALFLAVLHAPARFSQLCRPEFYTAVGMVRRSATRAKTSRRLQKIIRSLKRIQLSVPWQAQQASQHTVHSRSASNAAICSLDTPWKEKPFPFRNPFDLDPVSLTKDSPSVKIASNLYQTPGIPTPQGSSATFWPLSPNAALEVESNGCEDLSSFFEIAGGFCFEPRPDIANEAEMGMSQDGAGSAPNPLDVFQAEDEELTRVMAGLL
ncbi:Copper amine oxidase N2/N3-terminal [Penicillium waksmanii]|uniref:Copper amine oxidase N2/N3-terminal n=1 Tax=Penicillium waksmanii TaxID=69791 RepID=UPI00254789F1|nr:Copper amine oxidase N2/N3-terminal [Penicillium waksmanii]KAJ5965251.1 Copper amine oxidase N2/N3-terminal [Penicillium waksmanii]